MPAHEFAPVARRPEYGPCSNEWTITSNQDHSKKNCAAVSDKRPDSPSTGAKRRQKPRIRAALATATAACCRDRSDEHRRLCKLRARVSADSRLQRSSVPFDGAPVQRCRPTSMRWPHARWPAPGDRPAAPRQSDALASKPRRHIVHRSESADRSIAIGCASRCRLDTDPSVAGRHLLPRSNRQPSRQ